MTDSAPAVPDALRSPASRTAHRRAVVGLVIALSVAGFLTVAVATGSHMLDGFDTAITDFTRGWADPLGWPVDVTLVIGRVTAPFWSGLVVAVLVIVLFGYRYRAAAALLAMSGIAGGIVSTTVKQMMARTRPPGAEQFQQDLDKSFPSGHAMESIYLYVATGLVLIQLGRTRERRWMEVVGRILVIIGPFLGLTRVVLGVHWPSDVIAGWAFGSAVLLTSALILWWPLDRGWTARDVSPNPAAPT